MNRNRLWASLREQIGGKAKNGVQPIIAGGSFPRLISVHFPKAAGSSLVKAYETAFGSDRVLRNDHNDPLDPCGVVNLDPARYEEMKPSSLGHYAVVHGHFHPGLYDRVEDALRVVVLREPVSNLISFYYYWDAIRRRNDPNYDGHCLYRYFCKVRPSLLEFAALPAMRNLMSRVYFGNVDMARFDIIGDYDDLDSHLKRLGSLVEAELGPLPKENITEPSEERSAASKDSRTLAQLRDLLADDLRFYERYSSTRAS